jgi:hypothetical protein
LYNQGVGSGCIQAVDKAFGFGEFVVFQEGIEGYIDAGAEEVGVVAETANIVYGIAGGCAGAELRGADVDGVGAVTNGFYSANKVFGRRK